MGIDFEMAMAVFLKDDIPPEILDGFRFMFRGDTSEATNDERPLNPFPNDAFLASADGRLLQWSSSYRPASEYRESVSGLRLYDPEGYLYGGGGSTFPGEFGAQLRKVYRHNLPANLGGAPVYTWTLSFRVQEDMDGFDYQMDFANTLVRYSTSEGLVGYFRFEYDKTPTLLYCKDGTLYAYEVPWNTERLQSLRRE